MENLEKTSIWEKFDEWKAKQSPEELKQFYDKLENVTSSDDKWFEFRNENLSRVTRGKVYTQEINGVKYRFYKENDKDVKGWG